jgi:hypothetical protein
MIILKNNSPSGSFIKSAYLPQLSDFGDVALPAPKTWPRLALAA